MPPERGAFVPGADGVTLLDGPGGSPVGRIRAGVLLPYEVFDGRFARITTPCSNQAWGELAGGEVVGPVRVLVDPGHGGDEPGATGPAGLTEKEVNLDVSRRVVTLLGRRGISAVLTRGDDYRATLAFRVDVAVALRAEAFVSIHHNASPDEERDTPGTEAYYQVRSPESKRLTGLVQEEVFTALRRYPITWQADFDAGAKYRLAASGRDFYGVIRRSHEAGIPATLSEAAFISNPQEEALLRRDDVRQAEAEAVARGVERFFTGEEPGDVFTVPYARDEPAGPGGGPEGCVDPA